ncbi:bifunctional diacylglycerol diphosphate phosphatase/phosphatidate phosphatase [Cadophora gregata]|uniref:bifunctional diacylglycerol diphosphate phosphatase/phosphatidate phosphatase n=1 Tax=Cadophora gregata TaxID=51156 RepID=UPI0026DC2A0E|nr:bifunctional diacylglycerol diphosphate phosphatase/phosphatidate phosphatase [Cadophora gregata]KAK0099275.1 bifunctional diacylglycerol diphosphate phosphatase/phosphatidate phosphatase [Cadophora gregata f. sp. sojae]KAK0102759.1 bifunctional diacylglycerol diphosphate phosphatase/phosphatidate phosphatase [Cadophora gregata]
MRPSSLGYASETSQSCYYPGKETIGREEIEAVTKLMETLNIDPENTRLTKVVRSCAPGSEESLVFEILQASAEEDPEPSFLADIEVGSKHLGKVFLRRGDHSVEMTKICADLAEASKYAANDTQKLALSQLIETFRTGNYQAFQAAQQTWVQDRAPPVEHCMGFLFGYRDPYGMRAEWQGSAGIADTSEAKKMSLLVEKSTEITRTLPWAVPGDNNGKGPFEPSELDVPDFAVIHALASVSSTVWEATNITLDDKDGKRHGVKNMVYGNRMNLNSRPGRPCYYVQVSESKAFMNAVHICRLISTATHELIGHGTGKLLAEIESDRYNFDHTSPPISPITGMPVNTWYKPGESWISVFGKLAPTVEECRAFLIADYLTDNKSILALFGYNELSSPSADDIIYYTYLEIGVEGLRSLSSFNAKDKTWGGDHDRAKFAVLKHLLRDSGGFMAIEHDPVAKTLFVKVDRSKILSHGKPSIGRMLCKIHVWRSTADIEACRPYYEDLSAVDGEFEKWRQVVAANYEPKWKFVQPNTFINPDGSVEIREYEASNAGIIKSFFERGI